MVAAVLLAPVLDINLRMLMVLAMMPRPHLCSSGRQKVQRSVWIKAEFSIQV